MFSRDTEPEVLNPAGARVSYENFTNARGVTCVSPMVAKLSGPAGDRNPVRD